MVLDTLHAEEKLKERKIPKIWVEEAIKFPHETRCIGNKIYVTRKLNGKTLKVVYAKERNIKIITSFYVK